MRVAVIGAGSWGTAVADIVAAKQPVTLWARRSELAEAINTTHKNPDYPTIRYPRRSEPLAIWPRL